MTWCRGWMLYHVMICGVTRNKNTGNLKRLLCWNHGSTGCILPFKLFRSNAIGNRHIFKIVQWTRMPSHLSVIGNIGNVPRRLCGSSLGLKISVKLQWFLQELRLVRNLVKETFASILFDEMRKFRALQPYLRNHISAFHITNGCFFGMQRQAHRSKKRLLRCDSSGR